MTRRLTPLFLFLLAPLSLPAAAQDAGLYDQIASPGASFVRIIVPPMGLGAVGATHFDALETGISPYVVIDQPGDLPVVAGSAQSTITIAPASFYSYVIGADGAGVMVQDQITRGAAKADVAFYNLSDLPSVDLFVPAAKAVALPAVASGQAGFVALKAPLTLDFEARQGDTILATAPALDLKRREGVTLVLQGAGGSYQLSTSPNSLQP